MINALILLAALGQATGHNSYHVALESAINKTCGTEINLVQKQDFTSEPGRVTGNEVVVEGCPFGEGINLLANFQLQQPIEEVGEVRVIYHPSQNSASATVCDHNGTCSERVFTDVKIIRETEQ